MSLKFPEGFETETDPTGGGPEYDIMCDTKKEIGEVLSAMHRLSGVEKGESVRLDYPNLDSRTARKLARNLWKVSLATSHILGWIDAAEWTSNLLGASIHECYGITMSGDVENSSLKDIFERGIDAQAGGFMRHVLERLDAIEARLNEIQSGTK